MPRILRPLIATMLVLATAAALSGCGGADAQAGPVQAASDDVSQGGVLDSVLNDYQPPAANISSLDDDTLSSSLDSTDTSLSDTTDVSLSSVDDPLSSPLDAVDLSADTSSLDGGVDDSLAGSLDLNALDGSGMSLDSALQDSSQDLGATGPMPVSMTMTGDPEMDADMMDDPMMDDPGMDPSMDDPGLDDPGW